MWIEKRKDKLYALERFHDSVTGKNVRLCVPIAKDTAQARRQAQRLLADKWAEFHENQSDLLFSEIASLYFEENSDRLKEQTINRDFKQIRKFLEIVGDFLADTAKASLIKAKLKKSGKSNTTLNGYIKNFKIIMRWAYRNEYTDNIAVVDRLQKFPEPTKKDKIIDKFIELDELTLLIDSMDAHHWSLMTQLLALSGMRIGEAIALNNADVDFQKKTILINKTYVQSLKKISTAKTASSVREIHMQPELYQVANKIKSYSAELKMIYGKRNDIFFVNPMNCERVIYDVYEKYLRENSQRVLGRPITAHTLRHTFTSIYASKGISLEQISRQLGHSDSRITREVYYHVTAEQKKIDAERMDAVTIFL